VGIFVLSEPIVEGLGVGLVYVSPVVLSYITNMVEREIGTGSRECGPLVF